MSSILKPIETFDTLLDVALYFKDEMTCLKYLEQTTWNNVPRCPQCGMIDIYRYRNGRHFKCKQCKTEFTVKIGTIFESSKLPLVKWFMAMYLVSTNTKGLSSYQLARQLGVTQKTAWFMLHRIRKSLNQDKVELEGIVMTDESFIGGKNKNRHIDKKIDYSQCGLREFPDKLPVLGMLEKGVNGRVKTVVISRTTMREAILALANLCNSIENDFNQKYPTFLSSSSSEN